MAVSTVTYDVPAFFILRLVMTATEHELRFHPYKLVSSFGDYFGGVSSAGDLYAV
jgi:hypothetical protein